MNRFSSAASTLTLIAAAMVAACAGRDSAVSSAPVSDGHASVVLPWSDFSAPSEASSSTAQHLFVGNFYGDDVTEYKWAASGDAAPLHTIGGPNTGLDHPSAIAVDSTGQTYVGNYLQVGADVVVFASGASGDPTPVKTLTGPTGFVFSPNQFAIDASDDLYIAESDARIDEFAPDATATSAPIRSITGLDTGLVKPTGVALNASGKRLFVCDSGANAIFVFGSGSSGDVKPLATIAGTNTGLNSPNGIAVDSTGHIYVTQEPANDVEEFATGANGDATPERIYSVGADRPTSVGIRAGRVFVTEISVPTYVYAIDVLGTGSLTFLYSIEGSATGLDWADAVTAR